MKTIRCLFAAIALAASGLIAPVRAASYSTDQSDLWWIPSESGWGIQFVQRNSTIFATMFVYDQAGAPMWYVATMGANGMTWAGDLYATRGPWFATVPFDPANVVATKVGTMTWSPSGPNSGTLNYDVNGTQISKSIEREFIAADDFSGDYAGNLHQENVNCADGPQNGTNDLLFVIAIRQTGAAVTMGTADENLLACHHVGSISQTGQMGSVSTTFDCSDGSTGSFQFSELQVSPSGIIGRYSAHTTPSGCDSSGWFGGGRGTTF